MGMLDTIMHGVGPSTMDTAARETLQNGSTLPQSQFVALPELPPEKDVEAMPMISSTDQTNFQNGLVHLKGYPGLLYVTAVGPCNYLCCH